MSNVIPFPTPAPVIIATFHFGLDADYLIGCQADMLDDQEWLDEFDQSEDYYYNDEWVGIILSNLPRKDS